MTQRTQRAHAHKRRLLPWTGKVGRLVTLSILAALVIIFTVACQSDQESDSSPAEAEIQLAPVSQLSEPVRQAPPVVQEAYRFAIANPELLSHFPCYCSCGNMEHMSNLDCFVQEFNPDGSPTLDYHALG